MTVKTVCPVCDSLSNSSFWAMGGYALQRCSVCDMVWDPYPIDNLEVQYEQNYFRNENPKGGYANYFEGMAINRRTFIDRLKKIFAETGRKGKLLDVGCAFGDCLVEAKRLGWRDVEGLEISSYAYRLAKKRGLKVKNGSLTTVAYLPNSFGVITYQDVIEHIVFPMTELKRVYKILKPGGWLFIVTPDVGGFWSKFLGPLWYHFKPGEHVVYFSQKTIQDALERTGFVNIKTGKTYHVMSLEYLANRLRYYSPLLFGFILQFFRKTRLKDIPFRAYTGELEAWAQKPKL